MGLIKSKLPCDQCGSSDALAEYDENYYCFSCHWSQPKRTRRVPTVEQEEGTTFKGYPPTTTDVLPKEALHWLYKHHFTPERISQLGIRWWVGENRLVLPVRVNNELVCWEARSYDVGRAKYIHSDNKYSFLLHRGAHCTIVEDITSALRLEPHTSVLCLRGTRVDTGIIHKVKLYESVSIWTDDDKAGRSARKRIKELLQWVLNLRIYDIITDQDPKCYTDAQIRRYLDDGCNIN